MSVASLTRRLRWAFGMAALLAPVVVQAAFSGTDVFLPMVGRNPGIYPSQWYTTIWVYNPGDTAADVSFYLLERDKNNTAAAPYTDTIQPGDTRCYENALLTMFGKNAWGAIRVTSAQRVIVNERFYNQAPGMAEKDSQGQYFAGLPASFAIGLGERTDVIGIYQTTPASSSEFRYNYGFVEVTGKVVTVRLTPIDEAGTTLASPVNHQIQPLSQRQFAFKDDFPSVSTENARLAIEVVSGAGKVLTYGTGIANGSQDPTTFEMGFKAEALGIATVQHDSTLTGDGSAGAPLGLADGGVTAAKIDTTGAAHGQVIKAGSAAAWADDGLTLPFSGSSSDAAPAVSFAVANSSTGDGVQGSTVSSNGVSAGVRGVATDTFGVVGESTNWTGVYGSSTAGPGVHGKSTSGDGLVGESSGAGTSGVYAVNTNAAGYAGYFSGNVQVDGSFTCSACVSAGDLANGAVGKGKLSASGGGSGQVLGTTGSSLQWQNDGLTLPFTGSGSTGPAGSLITLSGDGMAVKGVSGGSSSWYITNTAVWGDSNASAGVAGSSQTATGVWGGTINGPVGLAGDNSSNDTGVGVAGTGFGAHSTGVLGAGGTAGVTGVSNGFGVHGQSWGGNGVFGEATSGFGIFGKSTSSTGVLGQSTSGRGVDGMSANDHAVTGESSSSTHAAFLGTNYGNGTWGCVACGVSGAPYSGYFGGNVAASSLAGSGDRFVYADSNGVLRPGAVVTSSSDARLKTAVVDLTDEIDVLAVLERLRGVKFNWDTSVEAARNRGNQREIGMIAQEVEAVLPELVTTGADGYETLDYARLSAYLIEVARAQQEEIASTRAQIRDQQERIDALEARLRALETAQPVTPRSPASP
jgi:Chaperone of endosialidase